MKQSELVNWWNWAVAEPNSGPIKVELNHNRKKSAWQGWFVVSQVAATIVLGEAEGMQVVISLWLPFDVCLSMGTRLEHSKKHATSPGVGHAFHSQGSREIDPHVGNTSKNCIMWMTAAPLSQDCARFEKGKPSWNVSGNAVVFEITKEKWNLAHLDYKPVMCLVLFFNRALTRINKSSKSCHCAAFSGLRTNLPTCSSEGPDIIWHDVAKAFKHNSTKLSN